MHALIAGSGLILLALALPGLIELACLTLPSLRRPSASPLAANAASGQVTVVIPAHNEQANLLPTLHSVQAAVAQARARDGLAHRIVVIADNCSDDTAAIARAAGVEVLERHDSRARGKGHALHFAFTTLLASDAASAGFVVIDADTRVPADFVSRAGAAFAAGLPAFQASYRVLNASDNLRTRWMQLALTAFNHQRLIARQRLGLSVGILGNGFGLSRQTLTRVPYLAGSVVEDLEYHIRLVTAGVRVQHLPDAEVRAEMPVAAEAAGTQRTRWEGGRFQMIREHSLPLLRAVLGGRPRLLEPLLELWLLPLAWQLLLFLLLALWPWPPTRAAGLLGLAVVALHILSAARQSEVPGIFGVLLRLPLYLLWKLARLGGILRLSGDRDAAWERTRRLAEDAAAETSDCDLSIVLVSFNTKHLLDECLETVTRNRGDLRLQVIVVDNASRDGSADYLAAHHPEVELIRSDRNLGFGPANNVGFAQVRGKYTVLLNTDAFLDDGVLAQCFRLMEDNPDLGLLGALLVGRDGVMQPSARLFPSLLNDFLILSGLAWRHPRSRLFGRPDRTWADPGEAADVDWVPGAFSIIRTDVLRQLDGFDTRFFLYYEEVDLCRRIRDAGLRIRYEPSLRVVHIGGESSKSIKRLSFSSSGNQLTLWRMRSGLMYYRKHHGRLGAWLIAQMELRWHQLRAARPGQDAARREESQVVCALMRQAWQETEGGRVSPPQPW